MAYKNPSDERLKASRRKHYSKNKEQYFANNRLKRERLRKYMDEVKSVPCADCNISYPPYVMDFDHRDPTKKIANVGKFLTGQSWSRLKAEIEKCDVVCSNCHRERTAKMFGYSQ